MERLIDILEMLEYALQLGSIFIWLCGFYILYQLLRLRFILWLIAAETTALMHWIINGIPSLSGESYHRLSYEVQWRIHAVDSLLRFAMVCLYLIGGILAVIYLQGRFRNRSAEERA